MLSIAEQQSVGFDMAVAFHDFCEKKGYDYCLAYGSMLGAVREGGCIPWDNDVDVFMPRPHYELFLEDLKRGEQVGGLGFLHWSTQPDYHYAILRLTDSKTVVSVPYIREYPSGTGIWLDVFPVDGWTDPRSINGFRLKLCKLLQNSDLYSPKPNESGRKKLLRKVTKIVLPNLSNSHMKRINQLAMRHPFGKGRYCSDAVERPHGAKMPNSIFSERILVPYACGGKSASFYIPKDYDACLREAYGDYMTPPPADKRETHEVIVEWK